MCGSSRGKKDVLRLVLAEAALAQGNAAAAHGLIRVVAAHWPYSPAVWNVYARVAAALGGLRHNLKSLVPLRHKHPACLPLALLTAHSHALTVSRRHQIVMTRLISTPWQVFECEYSPQL